MLVHQYDYAWPTGLGVFGPSNWLKRPMDAAKVPASDPLRRDLFKDLVLKLRAMQIRLAAEPNAGVVVVQSAGTLPDDPDAWANELHPTPKSFRRLAQRAFVPVLEPVLG